ncbi:MAG: hypothetical protein V1826_01370 [bacterium]
MKLSLKQKKILGWAALGLVIAGALVWWVWLKPAPAIEDRTLIKKTDEHTYELGWKFTKPIYADIVQSSIQGDIFLLADGQRVNEVPVGLFTERGSNLVVNISATPAESKKSVTASGRWEMLTYLASPSPERSSAPPSLNYQFDFTNGTDALSGTLQNLTVATNDQSPFYFSRYPAAGLIHFEYVYGNSRAVPEVNFRAEVQFVGGTSQLAKTIHFDPPPLIGDVRGIKVHSDQNFYYDVELVPTSWRVKYNKYTLNDGCYKDESCIVDVDEEAVLIRVTARNKLTGKIETNPYQRVKIRAIPLFYVNPEDNTHFEFPGRLFPKLSQRFSDFPDWFKEFVRQLDSEGSATADNLGTITHLDDTFVSRWANVFYWFAYHKIPSDKYTDSQQVSEMDIDLVDGYGETLFLLNTHYADADVITQWVNDPITFEATIEKEAKDQIVRDAAINAKLKGQGYPHVLITVQPTNYYLKGEPLCAGGYASTGEYRELAKICLPEKTAAETNRDFLYRSWRPGSTLTDQVYTIVAMSPEELLRSDEVMKVTRKHFWPWSVLLFLAAQVAKLLIGGLMIWKFRYKAARPSALKPNRHAQ